MEVLSVDVDPVLREVNANTLNCLVYAFVEKDFDVFKGVAKTIANRLLSEEDLRVTADKN